MPLLIAAGLFVRSLISAQTIDPGFDAGKIVTAPLNINLLRYTGDQGREFYRAVVERVERLPGAERRDIFLLVLRDGMLVVAIGIVVGLAAAAGRPIARGFPLRRPDLGSPPVRRHYRRPDAGRAACLRRPGAAGDEGLAAGGDPLRMTRG